ncbi:FGGY-family carbohydrate kinase [Thiohalobacter sp. IOR34]|uniref:FGGY-family carbohydrate kinase n=1 Tax=Thiohalobacter sp. IOR34 TaxID=3057176 RepID=UPI0025B1870C|nr:FGGY-family carbohydrate kinase [Thiohalobacter sp. IOR34]WJW76527.1 FGGY-family carbohydrate kinase [Thiohalobacter sp. IOR34]
MNLFLGIDFGTSGVRACLCDDAGRPLTQAMLDLPPPERGPDGVRQDPALWWQALDPLLRELGRQTSLASVRALAVDGTAGTLLLTDGEGRPLGPALMYNDSRPEAARRIAAVAPADSPARSASSSLAKLLHLLSGSAREAARHALHQAEWISGRLLGRFDLGDENNALKLGYDPQARRWPDWLAELPIPDGLLPEIRPAGSPLGQLQPDLARRWGLAEDTLVVAGTTDSTAAVLATGVQRPGQAVSVLGSTLVLKVLAERPLNAPEYGIYSHRLGDLWLIGGASNSGGAVLRRFFSQAQLTELTARLDPRHRTCLDYYPLPAPGERFPINDPALPPRVSPRPRDDLRFFQGLLEGMARIERRGYRLLHELGAPWPEAVYSIGGGASNMPWREIRERLLGIPVHNLPERQAACGSARLARHGQLIHSRQEGHHP